MPRNRIPVRNIMNMMTVEDKLNFFDVTFRAATRKGKVARWLASALEHAAKKGLAVFVEKLLNLGASPETVCSGGDCVLLVAVVARKHFVMHVLLDHHAPADSVNQTGHSALQVAALTDQPLMVEALLKRGASVNFRSDPGSNTALELAAHEGFADVMTILLDYGANVDAANSGGITALHQAAKAGNVDAVCVLVDSGANTNMEDLEGGTPLHAASSHNNGECVKALCVSSTDLNKVDREGYTPLQRATAAEASDAVKELLEAGADIESLYHGHTSALQMAAAIGCGKIVDMLIESGASVTTIDLNGQTALHLVNERDEFHVIKSLVKAGADLNARNNDGSTPLHDASWWQAIGAAEVLLELGADIEARDDSGYSPLHYAAFRSSEDSAAPMVQLLLRWGADETAVNADDNTVADVLGIDADEEASDSPLVLHRLAMAPADRAWRRRCITVMCRARFNRTPPEPGPPGGDGASGGACSESPTKKAKFTEEGRGGNMVGSIGDQGIAHQEAALSASVADGAEGVVKFVVGLQEEGLFRLINGFL